MSALKRGAEPQVGERRKLAHAGRKIYSSGLPSMVRADMRSVADDVGKGVVRSVSHAGNHWRACEGGLREVNKMCEVAGTNILILNAFKSHEMYTMSAIGCWIRAPEEALGTLSNSHMWRRVRHFLKMRGVKRSLV